MRHHITIFAACLVCIAAASCGHKTKSTAPAPVRVEAMAVTTTDLTASRPFSGTVEASEGSTLSFPVPGTLQKVFVDQGMKVSKGTLIAQIDPASLQYSYDMARATLAQAQDAYNRMKQLHDTNSLPDMQWVDVQNQLQIAQSAADLAKRALDDAKLYSPISGYVSEKIAQEGMTMAPGLPVVKIVTINPAKVSISVPENEVASIQLGSKATIEAASLPGRVFEGTITERGVAANPLTRAYDVKITVDNADEALLPGMVCDVRLQAEAPRQAIVLPTAAVLVGNGNQNFVWLASEGKAVKRNVVVGGLCDDGLVIEQGIADGDSVIISGQQKVSAGSQITVINR